MKVLTFLLSAGLLTGTGSGEASSRPRVPPKHGFPTIGSCYVSRVTAIEGRLQGDTVTGESGSQVEFRNGVFQVSYETVPGIVHSRIGDKVTMCVVRLPADCPHGDFRGVVYHTRNWRTKESWTLPNAEHNCGGA
jgi:hypothetical protein